MIVEPKITLKKLLYECNITVAQLAETLEDDKSEIYDLLQYEGIPVEQYSIFINAIKKIIDDKREEIEDIDEKYIKYLLSEVEEYSDV